MLNIYDNLVGKNVTTITSTYQFDNINKVIEIPAGTKVTVRKQHAFDFEQRIYYCYSFQSPNVDFRYLDCELKLEETTNV